MIASALYTLKRRKKYTSTSHYDSGEEEYVLIINDSREKKIVEVYSSPTVEEEEPDPPEPLRFFREHPIPENEKDRREQHVSNRPEWPHRISMGNANR